MTMTLGEQERLYNSFATEGLIDSVNASIGKDEEGSAYVCWITLAKELGIDIRFIDVGEPNKDLKEAGLTGAAIEKFRTLQVIAHIRSVDNPVALGMDKTDKARVFIVRHMPHRVSRYALAHCVGRHIVRPDKPSYNAYCNPFEYESENARHADMVANALKRFAKLPKKERGAK